MRSATAIQAAATLSGIVVAAVLFAGTAVAGERAQIARGAAIAQSKCSFCHAVGKSDPSPTRINVDTAFRDLHRRFPIAMLVQAAKTGYISGHDEMPGFNLPSSDISALLRYIDSLSPEGAPKYMTTRR